MSITHRVTAVDCSYSSICRLSFPIYQRERARTLVVKATQSIPYNKSQCHKVLECSCDRLKHKSSAEEKGWKTAFSYGKLSDELYQIIILIQHV